MALTRNIYYGGLSSEPLSLEESKNLVILRSISDVKPQALLSKIIQTNKNITKDDINIIANFHDSNALIFKISGHLKRDDLKTYVRKNYEEQIKYIGTVLQYKHSKVYQIYTGNLFIKFFDDYSNDKCLSFLAQNNLKNKRPLNFNQHAFFCEPILGISKEIFDLCEDLILLPHVQYCHPELVTELRPTKQFNYTPTQQPRELDKYWWLNKVNAFQAWKKSRGKGIKIAIIDDGLEWRHPGFKNKIVFAKDMMAKTGTFPIHKGNNTHGTACSSIACSSDPNAFGIAPEADIMPIRITGLGSVLQAEAIYWAVNHGADIISCSWGPPDGDIFDSTDDFNSFPLPDHTALAFEYARKKGRKGKGTPIIFAAGNGKEPVKYDGYASSKDVIAVAASNHKNQVTVYSDYGYPTFCCFPSGDFEIKNKKLINPSGIWVADRLGQAGLDESNYYALFTGTSASCPGVAGVIALMLAINKDLTTKEIKSILINSSKKIGEVSYDNSGYHKHYGYGMIDAFLAVKNTENIKPKSQRNMENKSKVSLHIGINNVDDKYYSNYVPPLYGCVNDMNNMKKFFQEMGFEPSLLQNQEATKVKIRAQIIALGNQVTKGGLLVVTYAGHGAPLKDTNELPNSDLDYESDGNDQAWVCYDGFMLDDEVFNALAEIQNEIRVIVISDSCYSESMTREFNPTFDKTTDIIERGISASEVNAVLNQNGTSREALINAVGPKKRNFNTTVLNLSASKKNQTAKEIGGQGIFSSSLIEAFREGEFGNSYSEFIEYIGDLVNDRVDDQDPNITLSHVIDELLLDQFPFEMKEKTMPVNKGTTDPSIKSKQSKIHIATNYLLVGDTTKTKELKGGTRSSDKESPWNKAYDYVLKKKKDHQYIEPNILSNIYYDGKSKPERDILNDGKKYLKKYPNPTQYHHNLNPFTWHLSNRFSQLERANRLVFPEIGWGQRYYNKPVVKIAHIDTGLFDIHPTKPINSLAGKQFNLLKSEKLAIDNESKFAIAEREGHGHATASILAGNWVDISVSGNQYEGFFGAIPYAKVLPIKISETVVLVTGWLFSKAIDYAIEQNCDVITMSMAGLPSKAMAKAVNRAYKKGIVIVSAAGNSWSKGIARITPNRTMYPARYDRVISAVGCTYIKTPYLNEYNTEEYRDVGGETMQSCYGPDKALETSLAAYTPNIIWFGEKPDTEEDNTYYNYAGGGTSSATPQIAAAAALYIQKHKDKLSKYTGDHTWKKAEIVRQALFNSADKISIYNASHFGNGMLKAYDALHPDYAPDKLIGKIQMAETAPEKKRFLNGIIPLFFGRSIMEEPNTISQEQEDVIREMMFQEVNQAVYLDDDLAVYQEINFEDDSFDIDQYPTFKKALINSKIISDTLKQTLLNSKKPSDLGPRLSENGNNFTFESDYTGKVNIRGEGAKLNISNFRSYKEGFGEQAYFVDEFEIDAKYLNDKRSLGVNGIELNIEPIASNMESAILLEFHTDDGPIFEWRVDTIDEGKPDIEHLSATSNQRYVISSSKAQNRGLGDGFRKAFLKVISWVKNVSVEKMIKGLGKFTGIKRNDQLKKLIAPLGDSKYGIFIYDLEHQTTQNDSGWCDVDDFSASSKKKSEIYKSIQQSAKNVLIFFPGLFSTVQGGFDHFLESDKVRKALLKKHCRYIIGFNMPTVLHGIEANTKEFRSLIGNNLSNKKCTVIARSRGGIVARYIFETKWVGKSPLILDKLIMCGTPNQGTQIADKDNWRSLLNLTTNVFAQTVGTVAPIIPSMMRIIKSVGLGLVSLDGIQDLSEESDVITDLNNLKVNRLTYISVTSNYEPKKWYKFLLDNLIVDPLIFKGAHNDSVTPLAGAIFKNDKFETTVNLDEKQIIIDHSHAVSHFHYLNMKKHPDLVNKIIDLIN